MQHHEIQAWLGNDHGLTDEQLAEFTTAANEIEQQYPDPDDQDEAQAALIAAYRLLAEDPTAVVRELAAQLVSARRAELKAVAGLKQAANQLIDAKQQSEAGFAREAGVDRMTVRAWRGKRSQSGVADSGPVFARDGAASSVWDQLQPVTWDKVRPTGTAEIRSDGIHES